VILVDDGSLDSTFDIVQKYSSSIKIIKLKNCGVEGASNKGINIAKGKFIVRVDADDLLNSNFLYEMSQYFEENAWSFLYPNYSKIDKNGNMIDLISLPEFNPKEIRMRGDFLATGTIYRKDDISDVGYYNDSVKNCGLENYELILKLLSKGKEGKLVNNKLFQYRVHSKNMSSLRRDNIISYGWQLAKSYELSSYRTNIFHPYGLVL
tara:strand:- start:77 stop:700 length:624 start_codon:yes stop_codon:yes gene_type:complete